MKKNDHAGFLLFLCSLVLCAQLQFVCVLFYISSFIKQGTNEAFLLSTGKDAGRRKPAARETGRECLILLPLALSISAGSNFTCNIWKIGLIVLLADCSNEGWKRLGSHSG